MALQTFTAGQVLTAAQVTALQANDYNQTVSTKVASYVLVAADKGTRVEMNSGSATTITVDTDLFNAGDTLFIQNRGAGVCTITAGTATVSTAGTLALAQFQGGTLYFVSAGVAIFYPSSASAGKILQVVTTFKSDTFTTTSNTFVDVTGLSVTITPTSATSKIFVIAQAVVQGASAADNGMGRLMRNSTPISVGDVAGSRPPASFGIENAAVGQSQVVPFLDSPATTSATTYKLQIRANSSGFTMNVNRNSGDTDATTTPRYGSSITVMEVSA